MKQQILAAQENSRLGHVGYVRALYAAVVKR